MNNKYRLGIDAGGTFTDFILADRDGDVRLFKVLSTPNEPTAAIRNGLALIAEETGISPQEVVSNSDLCINGTTVGLNALLTHSGAKTGLIATKGHQDSIEIRLGHKEDGYRYDPDYPPATMLVPRYLRHGITERVISDGSVRTPMVEEEVRAACRHFLAEDVESVAISFVWSVLHTAHELRAAEIVREMMPDVRLTVTIDMGGTSFDITLTKDGKANINKNIDFLRYRIGIPMIQVETLGAGGGSIGWIDNMGLMQVGPQSAGSEPGPACYSQGGENPTVTDANLVLGYLNADGLVGGRLPLDVNKAHKAIRVNLAEPLGISVEKAAYGMFTIVNNNMVNGIRRVSVERGYDPRDFALMGAGGGTGAHITALAREMGVSKVLMSKLASGLCAYGQILSDVKYNYMAPSPLRVEGADAAKTLDDLFKGLEVRGHEDLSGDGFADDKISVGRSLDMRYVGQVHECTVEIDAFEITEGSLGRIIDAFHTRHRELYTYDEPNSPVEVVNVESTIIGRVDKPAQMKIAPGKGVENALKGQRDMVFSPTAGAQATNVYDGALLGAGDELTGPAVIEEVTTTIVIEPGWRVSLHESGVYVLTTHTAEVETDATSDADERLIRA